MKKYFNERFVNYLIDEGIVSISEKKLYLYSMEQLIQFYINIILTILIGIIFGLIYESVLFNLIYIPLRQCVGGYHAKTPKGCYIQSFLLVIIILSCIKYMDCTGIKSLIAVLFSITFILIKAPVENVNKPLNDNEIINLKRKTKTIIVIESCFCIIAYFVLSQDIFDCTVVTFSSVAILAFIECVLNKHRVF